MPSNDNKKNSRTIAAKNISLIESPCVRNCCLDDKDMCVGCFRMLAEIVGWKQSSDDMKQGILEKCNKRKLDGLR